jgi:transposase
MVRKGQGRSKAYRRGGITALLSKPKGRPKGGKLTMSQLESLKKSMIEKYPDQLRLPGLLWTRELVMAHILRRFGVKLSRWTVGRHLKEWGLTPQKPAKRALEQNPVQVKYWLEHKYPLIQRQALAEGAKIWWGGEMGLRSDYQAGTIWGEKGRTPLIKCNGKRFVGTAVTAITNQGELTFMAFAGRFTVKIFKEFLTRLIKDRAGRKVFLIVDLHSVHKTIEIEQWLTKNKDTIRMFFLPPYSLELNSDKLATKNI